MIADDEVFARLVVGLRQLDATISSPDFDPRPMLAAMERAKAHQMPEEERRRMLALVAEAKDRQGDRPFLSTEELISRLEAHRKVHKALRERVIPNYGPTDPGDPLSEWRACVRVFVPDATDEQIDYAIRDAVRDGMMWWDGSEYHRSWPL